MSKSEFDAKVRNLPKEIIYQTCQLYMKTGSERKTSDEIAAEINREYGLVGTARITREQITQITRYAIELNMMRMYPPLEERAVSELRECFPLIGNRKVDVISTGYESVHRDVARHTAEVLYKKIMEVAEYKTKAAFGGNPPPRANSPEEAATMRDMYRVRMGFPAGTMAYYTARELVGFLKEEPRRPPLSLHALGGEFYVHRPFNWPAGFFTLFEQLCDDVKYYLALPSPYVREDILERTTQREFKEAIALSKQIDVMVTSMAYVKDPHSPIRRALGDEEVAKYKLLGDVNYRSYDNSGPVDLSSTEMVPTSWLTIRDMVKMARDKNRHVILAVTPCAVCNLSKAPAVLPLLEKKNLQIWSHLVMVDSEAEEVLRLKRGVRS
jgi:hypothetical protein